MHISKKIALIGTGLLSMAVLTACQSVQPQNTSMDKMDRHHSERHHKFDGRKKAHRDDARQTKFKQHMQAFAKACDNKTAGESVQVQIAERQIQGQCQVMFKPTQPAQLQQLRLAQHTTEKNTAEKPTQQQRMAQQQQRKATFIAQQKAFNQACEGQKIGQNIQLKLGEQLIDGQCHLVFQGQPMPPRDPRGKNN